ncbi:YjcQ family protein [Planococcus donghaensis]|uniref:YjcQ family protein n=1 Tax=Planococcus donghaensis TaxID=414778 RepID=UPI00373623B2
MNRKKLIFSILKEIQEGKGLSRSDYSLDLKTWGELALLIKSEEYATGIAVAYGDNEVAEVSMSSAKITMNGLNFLEENSVWAKAYKTVKEARDWFKI